MKQLEDFHVGQTFERTARPMSRESIMDFAREWDPQALHLDEAVAQATHGGLIASGFQTALHVFQPFLREVFSTMDNIGGLGLDDLRWLGPVRPDQPLAARMTITALAPSRSKPDRGVLSYRLEAANPAGEVVFRCTGAVMLRRRQAG